MMVTRLVGISGLCVGKNIVGVQEYGSIQKMCLATSSGS